MSESLVQSLFPHPTFRDKQHVVIEEIIKALYDDGYKNVVLDSPVGTGKSAILTTVLRYADNGFYTTPQRSLRQQLINDEALEPHLDALKARKDYHCKITNKNCHDCSIYQSKDQSCSSQGADCTYWGRKQSVMASDIAVLTFSFLIIDGSIPEMGSTGKISFGDREVLSIDEAQDLCQQVEEMHAGFKISPFKLPYNVFGGVMDQVPRDITMYDDVATQVNTIRLRCEEYIGNVPDVDMSPDEKACKHMLQKINWMLSDIENDRPWVADLNSVKYKGGYENVIQLRPIHVSGFLKNFVWNRAEKRIISTATIPYRDRPEIWLRKVGLDPNETKVINVSMPFPVENRPIHTDPIVGSMSSGGFDTHLDDVLETMDRIAGNHKGQKGLVHTASYPRAEKIETNVSKDEHPHLYDNLYVHDQRRDTDEQITEWQSSNNDLMLSPSMTEGVDLKGDMCRYQVLAKVPYPPRDSRMEYILNNESWGWMEMYERTLIRVVQSYGRAVRSKDDFADYYVLDSDFHDLLKRRTAPGWFSEAIDVVGPVGSKGIFDY